jgi:hypothetical protein
MFPSQSTPRHAPIVYRDLVTVRADAAPGGASQPSYTQVLAENLPAEVLQVSGGEVVRGKQVEAVTAFVVGCRYNPNLTLTARCQVSILSGVYAGQVVFVHRVHVENLHSRPARIQLHCKLTEN